YRSGNGVLEAGRKSLEDVNELPVPDYSGFKWEDYFFPERILTYISSRGCPWNKCSFCGLTSNYGQHYRTRKLDLVLSDIEYLSKQNDSHFFMFDDESIPENRLKKMSEMFLEKDLRLKWTCLSRLDSTMNKDTLQLAYRAGLRVASYGLESGSQHLINRMSKGTNISHVPQILKNSDEAGIWNNVFMFFGFPGETKEDVNLTKHFILENGKYIDTLGYGEFRLDGNSEVFNNPDRFGIDMIPIRKGDFGPDYGFKYRDDRGEINKAVEAFEKAIRFHLFNHENFFCIDLKRLLISLSENNKDYLHHQANTVMEKRIEKEKIFDTDLELLRIKVSSGIKYKKNFINNEIGYSYIFCNTEMGTSCELTGPVTAIIDFIDEPRTIRDITDHLCQMYKAGASQIEPYVKQVISSLHKSEILHMVH
ncbi:MAG TPA: radical SAM protein, partial [Ruminiclostridium sp.]|nr:radical SAM protein [Ruminiclostridium sp.]